MTHHPEHGFTKSGKPVHGKVLDYHAAGSAYQRFNKRAAIIMTNKTGTISTFWVFCLISLLALPSVLVAAHIIPASTVGILAALAFQMLISWFAQTFVQFVLLPGLMVGQQLQNEASDARSAKQFEDVEEIKNVLNQVLARLDSGQTGPKYDRHE